MSFSDSVKLQLNQLDIKNECCAIAEYDAIRKNSGNTIKSISIEYAKKLEFLCKKVQDILPDISILTENKKKYYAVSLPKYDYKEDLQNECCKKAYLRGCFISVGTINEPNKSAHLEMSFKQETDYIPCAFCLSHFGFNVKCMERKNHTVLYIKDADTISNFLTLIGAFSAMMEYENARILKSIRNNTNRAVNCDFANIKKSETASYKQIDDIQKIKAAGKFGLLSPQVRELALLRLDNPEASLSELGEMLETPISKGGVNHRMKKIADLASELK